MSEVNEHHSRLTLDIPEKLRDDLDKLIRATTEHQKKDSDRRAWRLVLTTIGGMLIVAYAWFVISTAQGVDSFPSHPHVVVIEISGVIGGPDESRKLERQLALIRRSFSNKSTKAVVLHINSPGGSPTVAQRIGDFTRHHADRTGKGFIAHIDGMGTSAAYLTALYADEIYASQYSITGSTGAIIGSLNWSRLAEKIGLEETSIASSESKQILSPWTDVSPHHRKEMQDLVDLMATHFVDRVLDSRGEKLQTTRQELMKARIYPAVVAEELGLIDGVGTLDGIVRVKFELPIHRAEIRRNLYEQLVVMTVSAGIEGVKAGLVEGDLQWR